MMCCFPWHSFFQTHCTTIDGQLLYNFVNKKLSILHFLSISYVGIVQIWHHPTYSTIQQTTAPWWNICRYGGMVLANQNIPPPGASLERALQGRGKRILLKLIIGWRNNGHIWPTGFLGLCSKLITFWIFVCWLCLIAQNVAGLFSSNSHVLYLFAACLINDKSRGSVLSLEIV